MQQPVAAKKPVAISLYGNVDPKSRAVRMEVYRETLQAYLASVCRAT